MDEELPGSDAHLTSGNRLARNVAWNLVGLGSPLVVAVVAAPLLIRGLGVDRFGILALTWTAIGYFSLFDLGLGRALTQLVAQRLGAAHRPEDIPGLVWTSLVLIFVLGLLGTLVVWLVSPQLVSSVLKVPPALRQETLGAFDVVALSIPIVISSSGLRGVLEATQRFDLTNAVRIPLGVFTFLGPLAAMPVSRSLIVLVSVLAIGRLVAWLAYLRLCLSVLPGLRRGIVIQRAGIGPLLRFGSWMTVSNVVSPIMVSLDRFLIAAVISTAAVAFYATPYEAVTKLQLIATALAGVLFPAFVTTFSRDRQRMQLFFVRGVKYIFIVLFPFTLLIVGLASPLLSVWLGTSFAAHSAHVLEWLTLGVLFNSLAQVPFAFIQAIGRSDLTAKLHLAELPLYLVALSTGLHLHGIEGAAAAWTLRMAVDAVLLFYLTHRLMPLSVSTLRATSLAVAPALAMVGVALLPVDIRVKVAYLVVAVVSFSLAARSLLLSREEWAQASGAGRWLASR